jgi:hypothetical protein
MCHATSNTGSSNGAGSPRPGSDHRHLLTPGAVECCATRCDDGRQLQGSVSLSHVLVVVVRMERKCAQQCMIICCRRPPAWNCMLSVYAVPTCASLCRPLWSAGCPSAAMVATKQIVTLGHRVISAVAVPSIVLLSTPSGSASTVAWWSCSLCIGA